MNRSAFLTTSCKVTSTIIGKHKALQITRRNRHIFAPGRPSLVTKPLGVMQSLNTFKPMARVESFRAKKLNDYPICLIIAKLLLF